MVSAQKGKQFEGCGRVESTVKYALLYEIGPQFRGMLRNIESRWAFWGCRVKDPFLFVSQPEAVVFSKLCL